MKKKIKTNLNNNIELHLILSIVFMHSILLLNICNGSEKTFNFHSER
jgi:hypothetical protein